MFIIKIMTVYKIKWKSFIADLYVPERQGTKIVVLLPGLPKSSNVEKLIENFLRSGCIVLYPNFSGSFDSGGFFDGQQCLNNVGEFIKWAKRPSVKEIYFGKKIRFNPKNQIILAGISFGALAALKRYNGDVKKILLLSPVMLLRQDEIKKITSFNFKANIDSLISLLKKAFPYTYRIKSYKDFKIFLNGHKDDQSQESIRKRLATLKIPTLIIHGKKDTSVPWDISVALKKTVKNNNIAWRFLDVGHSISSYDQNTLNIISEFIKN